MLKRIQVAVFQPSKIAFFLKDKMGYVFLYMALLAFLATLPMMIKSFLVSPMTPDVEQDIAGVFIQKAPDCDIIDSQLTCVTTGGFNYGGIRISFGEPTNSIETQLVFEDNQVSLYANRTVLESITYVELGITDLNLQLTTPADVVVFKQALQTFAAEFQILYGAGFSAGLFFSNIILYLAIAGIMAMSYGFRMEKLIYRYRFIMAAYATTAYFIVALIAELYGLEILLFFGMILPFVMMSRAFNGLIRMSKVVIRKKEDEE